MKKKKYFTLILFLLLLHFHDVNGQDPSFSQFYFNKLYFNPAFCGLSRGFDASLTNRIQWPSIVSKFNTFKFSADLDVSSLPNLGGIGIIAVSDVEGEGSLTTTQVGIPFSARVQFNKHWVGQLGFTISVIEKSINWDKFVFSDQFDNVNGIVRPSDFNLPSKASAWIIPDLSGGLIFEYKHAPYLRSSKIKWSARFGLAWHHVYSVYKSFLNSETRLPPKYTIHVNVNKPMRFDDSFVLAPFAIYENQTDKSPLQFYDLKTLFVGTNLLWKSPFIGFGYRRWWNNAKHNNSDAIAFTAGLKVGTTFNGYLSYTYDWTISGLMAGTGGSHEINLSYVIDNSFLSSVGFKNGRKRQRVKMVPCPEF